MDINSLSDEEDRLLAKLEEVRKKKEELSKPLMVEVTNIYFSQLQNIIEFKFSRQPEITILDRIRIIPSRRYIQARDVNQVKIEDYDRLVYELKECNLDLKITEEQEKKITEWKNAPDFTLTYNEKRNQIFINPSIRNTRLSYYNNSISTWTNHSSDNIYSFSLNELLAWMKQQVGEYKMYKFSISDEVKALYEIQLSREKLIEQFAEMKDADIGGFEFSYKDKEGNQVTYQLKPDQRVAIKFDDTFFGRSLISYDMGKGKTAIGIAQVERHNERVLFICKADLKTNIKREIAKFTGKTAHVFSGVEPDALAVRYMLMDKAQYNILNYDVLGRAYKDKNHPEIEIMKWVELINLSEFDRIIYDEAHYMKNMETQRSKGGRSIKATKVMLLTGTPIVNRPGELFPILNIIAPNEFSDFSVFIRQFTDTYGNPKNLPQLHGLLRKYMIRRLRDKSNDPNRIPQYTELSQKAKSHYNEVLAGLYRALRNPDKESEVHNILTQLLRLKQICSDDKIDYTVDLTETALDETEPYPWNKVLIFSQFKSAQAEIAVRLGKKARVINGEVTDKARYDLIDQFQDPKSEVKVIVTNITEGLTLTQAGTVIHHDLWWTPKDHNQAEGRAFGRENDPHGGNSYFVLAENTIEDFIWLILERKTKIAKEVIDNMYIKHEEDESMFKELINILKRGG